MKASRIQFKLILALWFLAAGVPQVTQSAVTCETLFNDSLSQEAPLLLSTIEAKLEKISGPNSTEILVRRGLTLPDYRGEHLLQFLFGNWDYAIASHDFSKSYQENHSYNHGNV